MSEPLLLDFERNIATFAGRTHAFVRRYEALFLASLAGVDASCPTKALVNPLMQHVAAAHGQQQPLNKKQISRLLESIEFGLDELGFPSHQSRIKSKNGTRTLGPWWWPTLETLPINVLRRELLTPTLAQTSPVQYAKPDGFRFTPCGSADAARALMWQIFYADAYAWDGDTNQALETLEILAAKDGITDEAKILVYTRLARVCATTRAYDEAKMHLDKARSLAEANPATRALHCAAIDLASRRLRYDRHPAAAAPKLRVDLAHDVRNLLAGNVPIINPVTLGMTYNLRALTSRRAIETLPANSTPTEQADLVAECIGDFVSAVYCLLSSRDVESTQNIISNLAYAVQKITFRGWLPTGRHQSGVEVCEWYRLAFAWHNRFNLAEDNVWEAIFFGEYWLDAKADRPTFETAQRGGIAVAAPGSVASIGLGPIWQGRNPAELGFYEHALTRATQIGEPRQALHAALNLYHFSEEFAHLVASRRATEAISRLAHLHPELVEVLTADGCVFPPMKKR